MFRPLRLRHENGTAPSALTPLKVEIERGVGQYIWIRNSDATQTLYFSFDGRQYITLAPNSAPLQFDTKFFHFYVYSSFGATTFEALIGEG